MACDQASSTGQASRTLEVHRGFIGIDLALAFQLFDQWHGIKRGGVVGLVSAGITAVSIHVAVFCQKNMVLVLIKRDHHPNL